MTDTRKVRFQVHSNLIDRFGSGLYDTASKALAELVANGHDAQATKVEIFYPEEWKSEARIEVIDDGDGMTPEEVEKFYLWIGMNRKVDMPKKKGRKPIGEFGIGKFAGLGIANSMRVVTQRNGKRTEFQFERKEFVNRGLTDVDLELHISDVPQDQRGTSVILEDLSTTIVPISKDDLVQDLSTEFSQIKGFVVYVNGVEMPFGFGGEVREEILVDEKVEPYGPVWGTIFIAKRPRDVTNPGLVVYANGRRMDGPTLFGHSIKSSHAKYYAYLTGWIEAEWLIPSETEAQEGRGTSAVTGRMGLLKYRPEVLALIKTMKEVLTRANAKVYELFKEESLQLLEEDREIMSALGHPDTPVSPATKKFLHSVVEVLSDYRPATRVRIAKEMKKHIETGEQAYFLKALQDADPEDVEAFDKLLKDFTLRQVTNVAWEVRHRYEALVQLNRMTDKGEETKEPILQRFFEKHPWVLQEGYEKYVPNKRLAKRLAGKGQQPDHLYVLNLANHIVIVELKRMGKPLTPDHAKQTLGYRTAARKQYQKERIDSWLVGERLNEDLNLQRRDREMPNVQIFTYDEILESVAERYNYLIQHLPKEAEWVRDFEPAKEESAMPDDVMAEESA